MPDADWQYKINPDRVRQRQPDGWTQQHQKTNWLLHQSNIW
jgi:hypothetical protein